MKNIRRAVQLSRKQSEWFCTKAVYNITASLQQKLEKEKIKNEKQEYQRRKNRRD